MFKWHPDKYFYEVRGVTLEMVVQAISDGYGVSDPPHWNVEKYPDQKIITVIINGYAHLVPYVIDGEDYFLKTIIPSRKANKKLKGGKDA